MLPIDGRREWTLVVRFTSDWHVGEGAGRAGHLDRLVRRDPVDRLPYVPAKTLTGIWRDACEAIAAGLDASPGAGTTTWSDWVAAVFGAEGPTAARLEVSPARYGAALRSHLATPGALRDALTFVKASVAIDRKTGVAKDKHLRFVEMACADARLEGTAAFATTGLSEFQERAVGALLWAGAQTVERLGSNRRRGGGRCAWTLSGSGVPTQAEAIAVLGADAPPLPAASAAVRPAADPTAAGYPAASRWWRVPLTLVFDAPVIVPARTVGNVVESLDFVPGTFLLPHVTRTLATLLGRSILDDVVAGRVRCENATLEVDDDRGRPVPFAWMQAKEAGPDGSRTLWNRAIDEVPGQGVAAKQMRRGYVGRVPAAGVPRVLAPRLQAATHAAIDDERQHPVSGAGGPFTYQAIRAQTRFRSTVWLSDDVVGALTARHAAWPSKLETTRLRLGTAKKDDYGAVTLSAGAVTEVTISTDTTPVTGFQLWLVSDLLLRGDSLAADASIAALETEVGRRLGVGAMAVRKHSFVRTRRHDGWNVAWGLPQPSLIALMAGSCVSFTCEDGTSTSRAALDALATGGLGERRAQGFGEIAVDDPLLTHTLSNRRLASHASTDKSDAHKPPELLLPDDDQDADFAALVESIACQREVERVVASLAADTSRRRALLHWTRRNPTNSQLGTVRALARSVRNASDLSVLVTWLDHLEAVPNRRDEWPDRARQELRALLTDVDWAFGHLELGACPVITASGAARVKQAVRPFAVRTLLTACIRAEFRDREKRGATDALGATVGDGAAL